MRRSRIYDGKAHSGAPPGVGLGSPGRVSHHSVGALQVYLVTLPNSLTFCISGRRRFIPPRLIQKQRLRQNPTKYPRANLRPYRHDVGAHLAVHAIIRPIVH